jgi:hypothetical protein
MARGLGGDDGPSLWMFVACVLVWGKVAGWFNRTSDKVSSTLELGKNSGGVFQSETTEEIGFYETQVKGWTTAWSTLPQKRKYYQAIAMKIFTHVKDNFGYLSNIDEDYLINLCKPLTANELKAVAICFGVKDINNGVGLTSWTGHIIHLWETILEDSVVGGNDLTNMKKIWGKTGLWV